MYVSKMMLGFKCVFFLLVFYNPWKFCAHTFVLLYFSAIVLFLRRESCENICVFFLKIENGTKSDIKHNDIGILPNFSKWKMWNSWNLEFFKKKSEEVIFLIWNRNVCLCVLGKYFNLQNLIRITQKLY